MVFSDSIEATFLNSCYVTRPALTQDASGNYGTGVSTIASNLLGDIQPARNVLYRQSATGADYRLTHFGFFNVPGTVPIEGDHVRTSASSYAVRNVRNFKDHLELELEQLGV